MNGITVTRRDNHILASKTATAEGVARLRHEAAVLADITHPRVVELHALEEGPPVALHTIFVGTDSWATSPPSDDAGIVAGLVAVASTVHDLHSGGVSHRALGPDHVLVAADGRPVLCGFADAGPADDAGRFADLRGLAGLVDHTAAAASPELGARLAELARRADSGGLDSDALARALAELDAPESRRPRPARLSGHRKLPGVALAAAGAALLLGVVVATRTGEPRAAPPSTESSPTTVPTTTVTPPSTVPPTTVPPTTVTPPSPIEPDADPLVIDHGGRRYAVGRADHVAVLGDWTCDGTATPAVLDPASGAVSFFAVWPEPGGAVPAPVTLVVDGAGDLRVDPDSPCGRLRVLQAAGSTLLTPEFR